MTDCILCGYRLETLSGTIEPFCAVTSCANYNPKAMKEARRKLRIE